MAKRVVVATTFEKSRNSIIQSIPSKLSPAEKIEQEIYRKKIALEKRNHRVERLKLKKDKFIFHKIYGKGLITYIDIEKDEFIVSFKDDIVSERVFSIDNDFHYIKVPKNYDRFTSPPPQKTVKQKKYMKKLKKIRSHSNYPKNPNSLYLDKFCPEP